MTNTSHFIKNAYDKYALPIDLTTFLGSSAVSCAMKGVSLASSCGAYALLGAATNAATLHGASHLLKRWNVRSQLLQVAALLAVLALNALALSWILPLSFETVLQGSCIHGALKLGYTWISKNNCKNPLPKPTPKPSSLRERIGKHLSWKHAAIGAVAIGALGMLLIYATRSVNTSPVGMSTALTIPSGSKVVTHFPHLDLSVPTKRLPLAAITDHLPHLPKLNLSAPMNYAPPPGVIDQLPHWAGTDPTIPPDSKVATHFSHRDTSSSTALTVPRDSKVITHFSRRDTSSSTDLTIPKSTYVNFSKLKENIVTLFTPTPPEKMHPTRRVTVKAIEGSNMLLSTPVKIGIIAVILVRQVLMRHGVIPYARI